jgi:hypothetical protein
VVPGVAREEQFGIFASQLVPGAIITPGAYIQIMSTK